MAQFSNPFLLPFLLSSSLRIRESFFRNWSRRLLRMLGRKHSWCLEASFWWEKENFRSGRLRIFFLLPPVCHFGFNSGWVSYFSSTKGFVEREAAEEALFREESSSRFRCFGPRRKMLNCMPPPKTEKRGFSNNSASFLSISCSFSVSFIGLSIGGIKKDAHWPAENEKEEKLS